MKKQNTLATILVLILLTSLVRPAAAAHKTPLHEAPHAGGAIIVNHNHTNLAAIPTCWIEQAKANLRVFYAHTSHGSQPVSGMDVLMNQTPDGLYDFTSDGSVVTGALSLDDHYGDMGDLGHEGDTTWADTTGDYLDTRPGINVVVWSWCGGVSDNTAEGIQAYLDAMNELEQDYPDVTFVYMTGHLDGEGAAGNLNVRNNQIRAYCRANGKVLFDFADIESFDPDGMTNFMDLFATDGCEYDSDGDGNPWGDANWAGEWCAARPNDDRCASCDCAHSEPLNCSLKGRAFWWMLARIAGWDGRLPQKAVTPPFAELGDTVNYTVAVQGLCALPEATVYVTDVIPAGLAYVPGTLTASAGAVDDAAAPTLTWSGVLTPTPAVTITYAATVTTDAAQFLVSQTTISSPGYPNVIRSITLPVNTRQTFLPLARRS